MVVLLTYFSLILGELVPKRLALTHPEAIASFIARPMDILATIARPLVRLLTVSTDGILRLVGVRQTKQSGVTVDEIRAMLEQGAEEGVFEATERDLVSNVLGLDERPVASVLTPRADVLFLDVRDPIEVTREKLRSVPHTVLPLCEGSRPRPRIRLDGALDLDTVLRTLGADAQLSDVDRQHYHTLGGPDDARWAACRAPGTCLSVPRFVSRSSILTAIESIACWPAGFLRRCHLTRHRLQTEHPPGS